MSRRHLLVSSLAILLCAVDAPSLPRKDLSLVIVSKEGQVCRGSSQLELTAEFLNSGKETVAIRFDSVAQIIALHPEPKIKPNESKVDVGSFRVFPLGQTEFVLLEPSKSLTQDLVVKIPTDIPARTKQLRITVMFLAQPKEKEHQNVKAFRGDLQSNQLKLDLVDCAGSKP